MMSVYHECFTIHSKMQVTFDDVTERVLEAVASSKIRNGYVVVYSQHTSCSVLIQEDSEGTTYKGIPYILQDTLNCLEKIIPTCEYEGQYLHPGSYGHIKSCIMGRSETIPVVDGEVILGEFGRIYFADFDKTRARERKVHVQIVGE